jgi:DNA polymerase-3 subunit epsilon
MQSRASEYQYVLNIQTTGLEPENGHRIIEIACVKLKNGKDTGQFVHLYVNPEGKVSDVGALAHHLISDDFLKSKPTFTQIANELMLFMQSESGVPTLVIHNAGFARKFLEMEMQKSGKLTEWNAYLGNAVIVDTWVMARKLHPLHNKLDELAEEFNVPASDPALFPAGMRKVDTLARLYPLINAAYDKKIAKQVAATAANTGFFSATAAAAAAAVAKPAARRQARKHVMG